MCAFNTVNPRCLTKTTIENNGGVYLFDGFYLLCHGDPPSVPQVTATYGLFAVISIAGLSLMLTYCSSLSTHAATSCAR